MNYENLFSEINQLKQISEQVMIYGFGSYGRNLYNILKQHSISVDGFVVTVKSNSSETFEKPVYEASDLFGRSIGYILALNEKNLKEVEQYLNKNNVNKENIVNAGIYMEQFGHKRGMHSGSIEITTVIGCKVNCRFCPQDKLLNNYFKKNPARTSVMEMETVEKCLEFFPSNYDVSFGGMSEPFLNEKFLNMLQYVCMKKRRVSLYTTLVGVKMEEVDAILSLPVDFVVLHVADQSGYANIKKSKEYYTILEQFVCAKKADGSPFVNMCNAQTTPDKRVQEICQGKYEILTEMTDRAGNLEYGGLICNRIQSGKISCSNFGTGLNNNILLPDGTVILCCMDFGLKHVLGNIYDNSFEEMMEGNEMKAVKAGMGGDINVDILCRTCSYARKIAD